MAWEDTEAYRALRAKLPSGWLLVKITDYTHATLIAMRAWLEINVEHAFAEVNWRGHCSYSTGVGFESDIDAILFKMRWSK